MTQRPIKPLSIAAALILASALFLNAANGGPTTGDPKEESPASVQSIRVGVPIGYGGVSDYNMETRTSSGIVADYLEIIEARTGIQIEEVPFVWGDIVDAAMTGKIDAFPGVKTAERELSFNFTVPFHDLRYAIAVPLDNSEKIDMDWLSGKRVAVIEGSVAERLIATVTGTEAVSFPLADSAIQAVIEKRGVDAFFGNPITARDLLARRQIESLRIVSSDTVPNHQIRFAIRKEMPEMVARFDEAINSVDESTRNGILKKWVFGLEEPAMNWQLLIYWVVSIIAVASVIIALIAGLNWQLKRKVESRTRELAESNATLVELNRKAEDAMKAKDEFLAVISHELRTPLNPILGFSEIIADELDPQKKDADLSQVKEYVDYIQSSSRKMLSLINNILDFIRIQKSDGRNSPIPVHLETVLWTSVLQCRTDEFRDANIVLEDLNIDGFAPLPEQDEIIADPTMIQQVVTNLLVNAVKYSKDGNVVVRSGLKEGNPSRLRIEVEDHGIGISPELHQLIFNPFQQADSSYSRRYEGIGLGLAICKKLVAIYDGDIGVRSEVGKGSTFWFEIPVAVRAEQSDSTEIKSSDLKHFSKAWNILVAEDNRANQAVITKILEKLGATADVVENGEQAVQACEPGRFDLVLMDLSMPVMNGAEATKQIRANGIQTPIVALTAHKNENSRTEALKAGMNGCLFKPVVLSKLAEQVESYL